VINPRKLPLHPLKRKRKRREPQRERRIKHPMFHLQKLQKKIRFSMLR
jgi:hypothetical protein